MKFIHTLSLLIFFALNALASQNNQGNWANHMIETYTIPADRNREEAIAALGLVPHNTRNWLVQKANQIIAQAERQRIGVGFHGNAQVLLNLATLALSRQRRESYDRITQLLDLRDALDKRQSLRVLATMPPNTMEWVLEMTRVSLARCPAIRGNIMDYLLLIEEKCRAHHIELPIFLNAFIQELEAHPQAINEDEVAELLLETQRRVGIGRGDGRQV
jgi:hypothetical protein